MTKWPKDPAGEAYARALLWWNEWLVHRRQADYKKFHNRRQVMVEALKREGKDEEIIKAWIDDLRNCVVYEDRVQDKAEGLLGGPR